MFKGSRNGYRNQIGNRVFLGSVKSLNRIREVLEKQGKTQAWLADELGVDRVTISRYVGGTRQPSLIELQRIAKILRVPGKDLINF